MEESMNTQPAQPSAHTPIQKQLEMLESNLDIESLTVARQISCMICNSITAVWDAGVAENNTTIKNSAMSKIEFREVKDEYGKVAKVKGITLLTVYITDEFLASQIPANMVLLVPTEVLTPIQRIIALNRKNHLLYLKESLHEVEIEEVNTNTGRVQ